MNKPTFQRHAYLFNREEVPMIEIWSVLRLPEQDPDNRWIHIDVVTRTAAEHERLKAFGEDTLAGNVVLPVSPGVERIEHFGAADQESAIQLLVDRHPEDPAVRQEAEALVYSL